MGGGRSAPAAQILNRENDYDDSWIHSRFDEGQRKYNELESFMNERRSALAQPKYYDVGGGMSVRADQFGNYVSGQLESQQEMFDQRLADMQARNQASRNQFGQQMGVYDARLGDISAAAGANQALIQSQGEAMARQGERARVAAADGDPSLPGVTGVQSGKRKDLGAYGTTGGGFNRSGLRIQNLNI